MLDACHRLLHSGLLFGQSVFSSPGPSGRRTTAADSTKIGACFCSGRVDQAFRSFYYKEALDANEPHLTTAQRQTASLRLSAELAAAVDEEVVCQCVVNGLRAITRLKRKNRDLSGFLILAGLSVLFLRTQDFHRTGAPVNPYRVSRPQPHGGVATPNDSRNPQLSGDDGRV